MIVTCERCSTQFRLDDKRVPDQGVRVRCSRCKYAFRVEPPAASKEERIRRAAARGLEPDTPDVTQDLPDDEADWQFNDDRPAGAADESEPEPEVSSTESDSGRSPLEAAIGVPTDAYGFGDDSAAQPADALGGGDTSLEDSGLDLADRSASANPEPPADSRDSFDLSGADNMGSRLDLAGSDAPGSGLDPGAQGEDPLEAPQEPRREARSPAGLDVAEEIGSPDKWDFFASDASEKAPTPARVKLTAIPPRAGAPRSASLPREVVDEGEAFHSPWLERIVDTAGWVIVAAVFALGLYGGFVSGAHGSTSVADTQRVADLEIAEVTGHWVENLVAGDLYVVSGVVRRDAAAGAADNGGLFLALLDARGERLRLAPIPVGPPLPQALLRQADPADLQRTAGRTFSPGPGVSQRVEAVIPTPPATVRAFRFVSGAELAALNVDTPVSNTLADGVDLSAASGEMASPETGIHPEEPIEAP